MTERLFSSNTAIFRALRSGDEISLEKGKEEWYETGDKIIAEGENDAFYVVLNGKVQIILKDGAKRSILSTYDSGDHFGELLIILGEHLSDHKCVLLLLLKKAIY